MSKKRTNSLKSKKTLKVRTFPKMIDLTAVKVLKVVIFVKEKEGMTPTQTQTLVITVLKKFPKRDHVEILRRQKSHYTMQIKKLR